MSNSHNEIGVRKELVVIAHRQLGALQIHGAFDASGVISWWKLVIQIVNESDLLVETHFTPLVTKDLYFWMILQMKHECAGSTLGEANNGKV